MSNSSLEELARKLNAQYAKTGFVLVGMHQELQEQKARIAKQQAKVTEFNQILDSHIDPILVDFGARAEDALAGSNTAASTRLNSASLRGNAYTAGLISLI